MEQWIIENWKYIALAILILDNIVKKTPTKKDDMIFAMIVDPIVNFFKGGKK